MRFAHSCQEHCLERESVAKRSDSSGFSAAARHNALAFGRAGRKRKGFGWAAQARLASRKEEAVSRQPGWKPSASNDGSGSYAYYIKLFDVVLVVIQSPLVSCGTPGGGRYNLQGYPKLFFLSIFAMRRSVRAS